MKYLTSMRMVNINLTGKNLSFQDVMKMELSSNDGGIIICLNLYKKSMWRSFRKVKFNNKIQQLYSWYKKSTPNTNKHKPKMIYSHCFVL